MKHIRIRLLGGFDVEIDGNLVSDAAWRHRRGADLVKLLALQPGHRLHREQAMEALWPDLSPPAAAANLRKAIHFARRTLGSDEAIRTGGGLVELWSEGERITDVEAFETAARDAQRTGDPAAAERAADLYAGDLLPGQPYDAWLFELRGRLSSAFRDALRLAGRWDVLVEVDPTNEEAHRAVIRAHLDAGNRQAAMRQFERLRSTLHEELGVGPDETSVALFEEILAAEGDEPPTPVERARSLLARALFHWNRMELDDARRTAQDARAIAIEHALEPQLGEASGLLGMVGNAQGRWRELFRDEFEQTLAVAPALAGTVFDAHLCLAEFALNLTTCDEILVFARELFDVARSRSSDRGEAVATLMLGEAELFSGRLDDAEAHLSRSADLHRRTGASAGRALAIERLAEAALATGRGRTRAARLLTEAMTLAEDSPLASHLVVRVYGARVQQPRDATKASAVAESAASRLDGADVCGPCSMGFLIAATIASSRVGDVSRARLHLDHAERIAGMWHGGSWQASVWEARGHVRLAERDASQAGALFREAADAFAACGRPLDQARCLASAAAASRRDPQLHRPPGTFRERVVP